MLLPPRKPGIPMGITHTTATIAALDRSREPFEAQFLIDTGAVDCLVPASLLEKAGVEAQETDIYELANGETVEFPFGFAWMTFMGTRIIAKIIFGPEHAEPILGVIALEQAGLSVDPTTETLKRMRARPLKRAA